MLCSPTPGAIIRRAMRTALILGIAVALAATTVVVIVTQSGGGRSVPDFVGDGPGVFRDPPFTVRIDGPLWRARTLQDNDGAEDFALVERDLPLDVRVTGSRDARVAQLELRVDGRSSRVVVPCSGGRCPVETSARFVPPLAALRPGEHEVEIRVRDGGGHVSANRFGVRYVSNVPPTSEGETISKTRPPGAGSGVSARLRRSALRVLANARRGGTGGIAATLGSARVTVAQAGRLDAPGRRPGVTLLVSLAPIRYDVRAVVPAYVPVVGAGGVRFATQQVRMRVAVLRDALVDVDLASGRVLSIEPGPDSRTVSWSPSKAPAPAGAADED